MNDTASDVAACVMCHDLPREWTQNCCPVCGRQRVDPFKLSPEQYGERLATAWADAMRGQLVLSLFTGAGLLDRAFEMYGACVVSAGDILHGKDIRDFHAIPGRFDGVIGGPPCQTFSSAALTGTTSVNRIPEYLRIIEESQPKWAVMENVPGAISAGPQWPYSLIRDFDCGGLTNRKRVFWFYGLPNVALPAFRSGASEHTVLASSWKKRSTDNFPGHEYLKANDAAYFQGYPDLGWKITNAQPSHGGKSGLSVTSRNIIAVHMLGNGVPAAMANYVAGHVAYYLRNGQTAAPVQMPLFAQATR